MAARGLWLTLVAAACAEARCGRVRRVVSVVAERVTAKAWGGLAATAEPPDRDGVGGP